MLKSKYPTSNSCLPERPNLVCLILLFYLLLGVRYTLLLLLLCSFHYYLYSHSTSSHLFKPSGSSFVA